MSRVRRRNMLGVCVALLFGVWSESASAWQFGAAAPASVPIRRGARQNPRDATASLEKRVAQEKEGRELFVRDWSRADSKPAPGGDGLGPMYNDVSCVACHEQGGTGGGGPAKKNVRLLHMVAASGAPLRTTVAADAIQKSRLQVHPDLAGVTSLVLHRHQFKDGAELDDYQRWLGERLPRYLVDRNTHLPLKNLEDNVAFARNRLRNPLESAANLYRAEGLPVRMTERNTPALFGAGLIDSIPDAAIVEIAERQKKQNAPLITGRVPTNSNGEIGRFGWRGQVSSLQEFVETACSVELGLNVPGHRQAEPVVARQKLEAVAINGRQVQPAPKFDLTQEQCNSLTTFVSNLPAPQVARSASLGQAKSIQQGSVLFEKAGCAVCHVPDVGPAVGIFSDLLLHDMGPNLSDPLPAIPELDERITPGGGSAYGQSFRIELVKNITTNIHQEWRTPPLWGVATSAPYLHDGRAMTLEQAIQMHGGEGQRAAEAFRALKLNERTELLNFLGTLAAPDDGPVKMRGFGGGAAGGGGGGFF